MYPLKRARPLALWLLAAGVLACSCSGNDVSLGEDLHPTPTPSAVPTPIPIPIPIPIPTPPPTYPCEAHPFGACLVPTEQCFGRFTTQPGYECGPGTTCCERRVGMSGPGGASGVGSPLAGAGGQ